MSRVSFWVQKSNFSQHEECQEIQRHSSEALARLLTLFTVSPAPGDKSWPVKKVIRNLGILMCGDPSKTPVHQAEQSFADILKILPSSQPTQCSYAGARMVFDQIFIALNERTFDTFPDLWDLLTSHFGTLTS